MFDRIRTVRRRGDDPAISLRKRRRWFDQEGSGGGDKGGSGSSGGSSSGGTSTGTGTDPAKNEDKGGSAKTFTQDELDAILTQRLSRAKETNIKELLTRLEIADENALAELVKNFKAGEQAKLSDIEKAQQLQKKAEDKATTLENDLKAERAARLQDKLHSAVQAAATAAKAKDPAEVLMWLTVNKSEDLTKAISEDGKIDTKAIEKLIGDVKAAKAYYFDDGKRFSPGSPSNRTGGTTQPDQDARVRASKTNQRLIRG